MDAVGCNGCVSSVAIKPGNGHVSAVTRMEADDIFFLYQEQVPDEYCSLSLTHGIEYEYVDQLSAPPPCPAGHLSATVAPAGLSRAVAPAGISRDEPDSRPSQHPPQLYLGGPRELPYLRDDKRQVISCINFRFSYFQKLSERPTLFFHHFLCTGVVCFGIVIASL